MYTDTPVGKLVGYFLNRINYNTLGTNSHIYFYKPSPQLHVILFVSGDYVSIYFSEWTLGSPVNRNITDLNLGVSLLNG